MKEKSLLLMLILLFLIPSTLALETNFKDTYQPGETFIMEISGNFIDNIEPGDILFYSGRAYIGMVYDVGKVQNKFYIYSLLPITKRNYTLIIKDVHYFELGSEKTEDLKFNFSVQGTPVLFSVNPGFIITDNDFNLKVTSTYKNIVLSAEFTNSTQESSIIAGQTKTLSFSVESIKNFTLTNLTLSSEDTQYQIPITVVKYDNYTQEENDTEDNVTIVISYGEFRFSKSEYKFLAQEDSDIKYTLRLSNTGQEDIEDIEFDFTDLEDIISISPSRVNLLEAGEMVKINITISSDEEGIVEGVFEATADDDYATETTIVIETIEEDEDLDDVIIDDVSNVIEDRSCSELGGSICIDGESCDDEEIFTEQGFCCPGTCYVEGAWTIGRTIALILLILIIGILGFFVYKKSQAKKQSPKELLKSKSKSYEERFKPKEIKGGLTRV